MSVEQRGSSVFFTQEIWPLSKHFNKLTYTCTPQLHFLGIPAS